MGRGAHAAHAAYNRSGTQGISVTNEINNDEEIRSVFITENDTTKQILHGHNISEMTCSGKVESITSERYKIFTPGENCDMLGDIYLNFEMDSEITDFTFVDTSPGGQEIDLQNVGQGDISKNFSFGGEDYNLMTVDYSNSSLPIPSTPEGENLPNVSYINKTLNVTYDNVNYEIVVGKGTSNIDVKNLSSNTWSSSNLNIGNFSEIIDVIMINVDGKDLLIVGGRPATTSQSPYEVLEIQNSNGTISINSSDLVVTNNYLSKDFNIIVKIFYENKSLIMSGFKYHNNEVLRAPDSYFHTNDVNYQTTFIITGLSWSGTLNGTTIQGLTFSPERDTVSKRLESYNYRDCLVSSSIKYDDTNYAYITGAKEKVLMALSPNQDNNNEIKRSYDNGLNWEDVDIYQTPDNYYPMSTLYKKNETLVHTQLNIFGFLVDDLTSYTINNLKTFIVDTYGYIKSDIKVINKLTKMEYDDTLTLSSVISLDSITGSPVASGGATEYNIGSYLDIRIKNSPIINDYEHIWINIKKDNDNFKKIWPLGKNIRMTSKKPYGAITRIIVTNGGTGYSSSPSVTINPNDPNGTTAGTVANLTDGVVTSINVVSGKSGYTSPPTVTIEPSPSGETATATAVLVGGVVDDIIVVSGGSGYTSPPIVTIDHPPTAVARPRFSSGANGEISSFYVIFGGSGYTSPPIVTIAPPPAATATAVLVGGVVNDIIVVSGVSGYTSPPTVTIEPSPSGETATATAFINASGVVTSINVDSGGSGYISAPTVTIAPPPAATATAVLVGGVVNDITVESGGSGYISAPTVTIAPPPAATATAVLTDGILTSIDISSSGSGYDGTEAVIIGGTGGASAIIDKYSIYKEYLTFGQFKQNISGMLGLTTSDYNLKIKYTLSDKTFIGNDNNSDNKSVFELGLLQVGKIDILKARSIDSQAPNLNFIRLGGTPQNAEFKPVDERLNDKFKIHLVVEKDVTTVLNLKNRLVEIYGGSNTDYLICRKTVILENSSSDNTYTNNKVIYGSTNPIINSQAHSNNSILDTYTSHNMEIRFADTHPILQLSDPKIVYVSIPLFLGNDSTKRRTVSLIAYDSNNPINYITLGQLKTKIKKLLDPFYTQLINTGNYYASLVKGGSHNGYVNNSNDNFYGAQSPNVPHFADSLKLDDETLGIKSGDILYFYFAYVSIPYVTPGATNEMAQYINISLSTDPLYSEKIISTLGVMDDLKYYIPNVNVLVNNDKGLWVAAGTPGDPDFSITANHPVSGIPIEEVLKRPNLFVFVSNNDGYNWHPVKFSVIKNNTLGISYKDADIEHYDDPKYKIEYVSGYVSNSRGDIRITFNIYDTSIGVVPGATTTRAEPGKPVTSCVLDIDHYKICPDVISNYSLKAIKMSHIIDNIPPNCPLTYADSINEFDVYTFHNIDPHAWSTVEYRKISTALTVQTINSDIIYTYNEKIKISGVLTETIYDWTKEILYYETPRYKSLDSFLIKYTAAWTPFAAKRTLLFREIQAGYNSEIIKIDGNIYLELLDSHDAIIETDSNKKAVLLHENLEGGTNIYTYDDKNLNFRKVAELTYRMQKVNFLENTWIISGTNKLLISYDTEHWREVNTNITINELFSKNNRHHDVILTYDSTKQALKHKVLTNTIDKYKGISLFHDISIRGGIKVNIDEELIADRTNYIVECYGWRLFINTDGYEQFVDMKYINNGILYEPNDIIKISNQYIICGNNTGLNGVKTISLMDTQFYSIDGSPSENTDDIVFMIPRSLYTHYRQDTNQDDFISNFNMERFYKDTNVYGDLVYCSGSYTNDKGTYGILASRSIPLDSERNLSHPSHTYLWKLIYGPPTGEDDAPLNSYQFKMDFEEDNRAQWQDTIFEKINDLVFADNMVVIVGKGKNEFNLYYSEMSYPEWFGLYPPTSETHLKLNFQEIHTVCFYNGYWFVGGKPIYETISGNLTKNNYCLAYTNNILGDWTYKNFPSQASNSSIYEVNNMEAIDINGNKSILTNISYIKKDDDIDNLVMAIIFINIDHMGNLSFTNGVEFNTPGIKETKTSSRTWNGFNLYGDGFDREKWLNRPFDLEINGINRNIISTIHFPRTNDMYYVEYNSNLGFILIPYRDPYIPIIDKSETGEYPKFIKHVKLGSETLTNKTRGHCYKIAKVTNENFITGLNSARYIAIGKGVLSPISYSDDFENWTYSDAGNVFDIVFDVAHAHGLWIAVGEGNYNIGISKDGKTWSGIYSKWGTNNLMPSDYDSTLNSLSFSPDTKITDILPYVPNLKGIFLRNLSILRLFSRIEYHVGAQIWQTLTFDDIKALLDTEFGAGEYAKLLKNCSTINKNGSTKLTTWIPGFTKTLNSKLETFANVSERGSFPSGLLKDQKLSIKVYYNNLENVIGNELTSSDMNSAVFDNFMNNTLMPCDRDPNYFIDSFLADNYGFQLGDNYQNVNGKFRLKYKTEIQRLRLYCKQFELDEIEIEEFNKGIKQVPKITQSLYFDADNVGNLLLDLDNFNMYASHIIVSGWLTFGVCITDMNLELNGYSYNKTVEPSVIDFATKLCLGLNYNRYTFNGVDKEDGTGSLVIPLASTAYSGSSVPLDRYSSIRLRINFNTLAGPKSYINVTCVGTTTVSYNNSTANIEMY